jgi:hypothetical protein
MGSSANEKPGFRFRAEEGKTYFVVKNNDGQQLLSRRRTWGLR